MEDAIVVKDLRKSYFRRSREAGLWGAIKALIHSPKVEVPAVKSLSFSIRRGETVGLIGENGAGKSTTIKMLTGILDPSGGVLRVLGLEPWRQRQQLARRIGVVFGQRPQLLWDIPVRETFTLLRDMYDVPAAVYAKTSETARHLLDLDDLLKVPVRQLSLGQRMRCDLAAAVLHAPDLIFLDEPTIGLDVVAKRQARELIKWLCREFGTTLVLTTHDLKDITETCRRVILLDKGGLLFDGSLKGFEKHFAKDRRLIADFASTLTAPKRRRLETSLKRLGCQVLAWKGGRLTVSAPRQSLLAQATRLVLLAGEVEDLNFERTEIEQIVHQIYAKA